VPPRWHLRTQISRKTLFDLIQDRVPSGGLPVASDPDILELEPDAIGAEEAPGAAGVLPQACLDPLAATLPMPLHPPALWNDGDTTPDLPEHWRPITITLASPSVQAAPTPPLPATPPAAPGRSWQGAIKTAGWMLSGAALTFLISAAAFGGRPMLRAIRGLSVPRAQTTPEATLPATETDPQIPARAAATRVIPASAPVIAIADRPSAAMPSSGGPDRSASAARGEPEAGQDDKTDGKTGTTPGRFARRSRQDRRLARSASLTESGRGAQPGDGTPLGADDAVMPLASAVADGRAEPVEAPTVTRPIAASRASAPVRSAAMAKTISARVLRPIDVEDPFGER